MVVKTHTWMSAPSATTPEIFRKWARGIHDALLVCGVAKSEDTGQIDFALAEPSTTSNTPSGYNVFYLDDDLHASYPVYFKIEYGRGNSTAVPRIWLTVGRGSDGAGNITGILHPRETDTGNYSQNGTTSEFMSYASGDGSCFALAPWAGHAGGGSFFLAIERSRDPLGDPTGEGVLIVFRGAASGAMAVRVIAHDGTPDQSGDCVGHHLPVRYPFMINGQSASTSTGMYFTSTLSRDGVHAPVMPIPCLAPGVTPWVSNLLTAVHPGDAGSLSVIQAATINGETRRYRAWSIANLTSGTIFPTMIGSGSVAPWWPAILWSEEGEE